MYADISVRCGRGEGSRTRGGSVIVEDSETNRPQHSIKGSRKLELIRQRDAELQAVKRRDEQKVKQAQKVYVEAETKILTVRRDSEVKVEELEAKIHRQRELAEAKVAAQQTAQARAVLTMNQAGRTIPEIAVALAISLKVARGLVAQGKAAGAVKGKSMNGREKPPVERSDATGVDAGQTNQTEEVSQDQLDTAAGGLPVQAGQPHAQGDPSGTDGARDGAD